MPLDRRAERLLAMLVATDAGPRTTPAARREALITLAAMADAPEAVASSHDHLIPGPGGPLRLRLYAPEAAGEARLPGLVFLHGGGWVAGGLETHDGLCRRLCAASGFRIIAVDYRLAPEHPFPAAFDDGLAAVRWVAGNAARLGVDARRLGIGGDSVGGGLAAAIALALRDGRGPRLALQVLICPILDVARQGGSREAFGEGYFISQAAFARDLDDYAAPKGDRDLRLSPGLAKDLRGLPTAIIHTAEFDPFRDEAEAFAWTLESAGVTAQTTRHAGMIHYFYALARAIPYARDAATTIGAQMCERLNETAPSDAAAAVA